MAHSISKLQNEESALRRLAAQRHLYGNGKKVQSLQIFLSTVVPVALLIAETSFAPVKAWAALFGISISILDAAFLEPLKDGLRKRAAATQELFDCQVLNLEWPVLKAIRPDPEDIQEASSDFQSPDLRDWYPTEIEKLPLPTARLVCQRSNCWWDSKLRRTYRIALIGILIAIGFSLIGLAVAFNLTVSDFVLSLMAPSLPLILWMLREAQKQSEAAKRADNLKSFGDNLWKLVLEKKLDADEVTRRSRTFQDAILEHRQKSSVIFDWVYRILKSRFENQMHYGAAEMVMEAEQTGI